MKIFRGLVSKNIIVDIELDEKSRFQHTIMGDEFVELQFALNYFMQFIINDYILFESCLYQLNQKPSIEKNANNEYVYNLRFESAKYDLGKCLFLLDENPEFWLLGDADTFVDLVIENMSRLTLRTFTKGIVAVTDEVNLNFQNENCLSVLNRICQELGVEFEVINSGLDNVINVRSQIGYNTGLTLAYKQGIKNIQIQKLNDENICTKLYAYGSEKNLPADYQYKRLRIAPIQNYDHETELFEKSVIFEDIYPHYEGSVDTCGTSYFTDSQIDFNLNDYLVPGLTPKVVFLTGDLSGYEFDIVSFDNGTKQVVILPVQDETGTVPNGTFPINIGDKYTFVDLYMPASYITDAEAKLTEKANEYVDKYSQQLQVYNVTFDERYLAENDIRLKAGNQFTLTDSALNLNVVLRILNLTRSVTERYTYTAQLTDEIQSDRFIDLKRGQYDIERKLNELRKQVRIIKNN